MKLFEQPTGPDQTMMEHRVAERIISRTEANAQGLIHFFTGKPCKHGHISKRFVNGRVCVECNRANGRRHYLRNPDKIRAKRERDKELNPDRYRAFYQRNADKRKAQANDWYYANRDRALKACKEWAERNPEKVCAYSRISRRKRRALQALVGGSHTRQDLDRIYQQQRGKCAICRCPLLRAKPEVDHIIPISRGGGNSPANLQYLCRPCNRAKAAKDPVQFAQERGLLL